VGTEQEGLATKNHVVVAIDHDEDTEEILRVVREGGGNPHLATNIHAAYNTLIELSGQPSLLVRYQLEGTRNMGARLLDWIKKSPSLSDVPTIVLNNNPSDSTINDFCYKYYKVNHVIDESEFRKHIALIDRIRDESTREIGDTAMSESTRKERGSRIFIIHRDGHPEVDRIVNILHRMTVDPIVLPGEATLSKTIIEAIEYHSDVAYGMVLLTADDYCTNSLGTPPQPRARQNVILEAGYLMGRLKRERVLLLYEKGVELPSDLHGVLYTPLILSNDKLTLKFHQIFEKLKIPHEIKTY